MQEQYDLFLDKGNVASSSPDLNPMDFSMWSIVESKVCSSNHRSIATLKHKVVHCWDEIPAETIHATCSQVVDRLKLIVRDRGGHIKI